MRVIVRPHHHGGVEPPPTLKSSLDAVARFELSLLFFTFS